jgi:hypothetical protein
MKFPRRTFLHLIPATLGEVIEAVRLLNIHELTDYGMKPGEVKQYV